VPNENKIYPEEIIEAAKHDTHEGCPLLVLSNCAMPACWLPRMRQDDTIVGLRATAAGSMLDEKIKLTYGKIYNCTNYDVIRDLADGAKFKLIVHVEDDTGTPFKAVLDEKVGPFEICIDEVADEFRRCMVEGIQSKIKTLRSALASWNAEKPAFKVNDLVKIKKNMYNNGTGGDNVYMIAHLGEDDRLLTRTKILMQEHGFVEPFDCVLASLDGSEDLVFTPCTTNRLELLNSEVASL
jgi:hypothetical protein